MASATAQSTEPATEPDWLVERRGKAIEAAKLIVNGFIEPITKELPMEYAVEMNRLIELQMEGSIG